MVDSPTVLLLTPKVCIFGMPPIASQADSRLVRRLLVEVCHGIFAGNGANACRGRQAPSESGSGDEDGYCRGKPRLSHHRAARMPGPGVDTWQRTNRGPADSGTAYRPSVTHG